MDFARAWLPKPKARLITVTLAFGCLFWVAFYFSSPRPLDHFPGEPEFGRYRYPPPRRPHGILPPTKASVLWNSRAEEVKDAFLHAYRGYMEFAAGHDELLPMSDGYVDK